MPPKGTQAAQKTSKKNDKKSSVPEVNLDDFFTRFLAKKRRNLNKKLTKIETYEKTPADKLQPDHKEILASKPDTLEKLTYFDTIGKLYIEAYLAKDEDDEGVPAQSQSPQRQEEHRAPAPQAAAPAFNHEENNTRIAASLAQLLTAGSYFAHTHQRENFNKLHGAALSKKYGSNFLEGLGNLWRTLTEQTDAENSVRAEEVAKIIENFLNNSALISPATNTTYQRLQEAIRELGSHQGFQTAIHGAHSKTATHHAPATHHEEVHEPQSEVKAQISLVKSSRKNSKRSRLQSEVETEAVHHHETHAETAKPSKPAKEVDPDAPAEDDEWFRAGGNAHRVGRGGRGRGRGNGRGGRDGPRREEGGNPRPRTERREDRDEKTEGGRTSADGEKRQFRGDGERRPRGDGERRPRGDGERRPRGDGERRPRGAWRGEGDRKPRGDRGTAQNEGANQETN